jgi:hypothetical protein
LSGARAVAELLAAHQADRTGGAPAALDLNRTLVITGALEMMGRDEAEWREMGGPG